MINRLRELNAFALGLTLSIIFAVMPLTMTGVADSAPSAAFATVASAAIDQEVIARVRIESERDLQHLSGSGVQVLGSRLANSVFVRASLADAKQLENDGWDVEILYRRDAAGKWEYLVAPNGACEYSITPESRAFTYLAGFGSFDLTTGSDCEWTVVSGVPWLTVHGVQQGTGSATITYSVSENPDPTRRVAEIFIQGAIFTVRQGVQFDDVLTSHPSFIAIGKISAHGITVGCTPTSYCPDASVTRDTMAAFLSRAVGVFEPPPPAMQRFTDVPPSNPFYAFIEEIAFRQITLGCGVGIYCPGEVVTREQMAAFILRAIGEPSPPTPAQQRFQDVPPSNQFYNFIDRMAVLQITLGCSATPPLYCPSGSVTRGDMAVFLVRAFDL